MMKESISGLEKKAEALHILLTQLTSEQKDALLIQLLANVMTANELTRRITGFMPV